MACLSFFFLLRSFSARHGHPTPLLFVEWFVSQVRGNNEIWAFAGIYQSKVERASPRVGWWILGGLPLRGFLFLFSLFSLSRLRIFISHS